MSAPTTSPTRTVAYSYIRFSHPSQAAGDSLRRQTEGAAEWCRRNNTVLDTDLTLRDLGVSAFKGKNAAVGNFRTFLDAVKSGKVKPGSVLIVESFDRISRQGIDEGYDLVKSILKAGVRIVTLSPERTFDRDAVRGLSKGALEIQLILERAAEESERKSTRVGAARETRRRRLSAWAAGDRSAPPPADVVIRKTPGWVRTDGGRMELIPDRAAAVRRMFDLARTGSGTGAIARELNVDGVPVFGRAARWDENAVHNILRSPAVYGAYQPCVIRDGARVPAGNSVEYYYPAVTDRDTYYAVQAALRSRTKSGAGRRGKHTNLFSGLLHDWVDGGALFYRHNARRAAVVVPVRTKQAGAAWASFPAASFDAAIISQLREVPASEVTGDDPAARRAAAAEARLTELDRLTTAWTAKMNDPDLVDVVSAKLRELAIDRKTATADLDAARRDAAVPTAKAATEFKTLAGVLAANPSAENRAAVRAALRRYLTGVRCFFAAGTGSDRLGFIRVDFRDGTFRLYAVLAKPRSRTKPEQWTCFALRHDGDPPADPFSMGAAVFRAIAARLRTIDADTPTGDELLVGLTEGMIDR